jgi:hypothetical protein
LSESKRRGAYYCWYDRLLLGRKSADFGKKKGRSETNLVDFEGVVVADTVPGEFIQKPTAGVSFK